MPIPAFLQRRLRALILRRAIRDTTLAEGYQPIHKLYLSLQVKYTREGLHTMDLLTVLGIYHYDNDYITALVRTPRGRLAHLSFLRSRGEWRNSEEENGGLPTFSVRDVSQFIPTVQRSSSDQLVSALSFAHAPLPLWELVALVYSMNIVFPTYKLISDILNPYGAVIMRALGAVYTPNVLIKNAQVGEELVTMTKNNKDEWVVLRRPDVKQMDISPLLNQFQKAKNAFEQPVSYLSHFCPDFRQ